jgi:inosose dehydratase
VSGSRVMAIRLGINPIGWSNDDLRDLGGDIPLETCLAEARRAGFSGIELGHKFPRDPRVLAETLRRFDLALVSGWYSTNLLLRDVDAELRAVRDHADLLLALGCDVIILAETSNAIHGDRSIPLSQSPGLTPVEMRSLANRLTALSEGLADMGLKAAYHHHMGTVVETPDEIDALMHASGEALGLLLDTGHCLFAGGEPAALAARHGDRVVHVHCKDIRAPVLDRVGAGDFSFLDAVVDGVFTVPGDGCVDYPEVFGVLADKGYDGWLVVEAEQDPKKAPPAAFARLGFQNLDTLAGAAGFNKP